MAFLFAEDCQRGVDLAKRSLARDGDNLSAAAVLAGLLYATRMKELFPELLAHVPEPHPVREASQPVGLAEDLRRVLCDLRDRMHPNPISSAALFFELVKSPQGREALAVVPAPELAKMVEKLEAEVRSESQAAGAAGWKESPERQKAFAALDPLGRVLTRGEPKAEEMTGRERELHSLVRVLCKLKRHNAIITGEAGSGKTALVRELARRIVRRDASLPESVLDLDIFELEPMRIKAGASIVGEYEKRIRDLVGVLRGARRIVLFIDEIHAFFQSSTQRGGPFAEAHESLKAELARGEISCIGCTTLKEYRHFIEPDAALARRFALIRIEPPDRETTLGILRRHKAVLEAHFRLTVPDGVVTQAVDASELYLPTRFQPDKSLQLLEDACAFAYTERPQAPSAVGAEHVRLAVEDVIGHAAQDPLGLREDDLFARLREKIVGQDEPLRGLSHAVVTGLHAMTGSKKPLRVFVFFGPSGVGKTETALKLSEILGAGRRALVQVDCNTLWDAQGDGIKARLFGPPPGYVGYIEGHGGLLSRVRDFPYSVLLFDEFEKGPAALADILLEILDKGQVEDNGGNLLDFRRSFVVFATNLGWQGEARRALGFPSRASRGPEAPTGPDSKGAIQEALRKAGVSDAFLGRVGDDYMFFAPLGPKAVEKAIERLFGVLGEALKRRNLTLSWGTDVIPYLTKTWEPRFGVRHLKVLLENRVIEQLSLADMDGELKAVKQVRIEIDPTKRRPDDDVSQARTVKRYEGDSLILTLI